MTMFKRIFSLIRLSLKYHLIEYLFKYTFQKKYFKKQSHIQKFAQDFQKFLENSGPIFIKLGQNLSIHAHVIHPAIIKELEKLQDQCQAVSSEYIQKTLKSTYGQNWQKTFYDFDPKPLACASIAQVHTAKIKENPVILKILRPNITKQIKQDSNILSCLVFVLELLIPKFRRLKIKKITHLFQNTLLQEANLLTEAANASQIKRTLKNHATAHIPDIYWEYCTENILVQQRFFGDSIKKGKNMQFKGVQPIQKKLANNVLNTLLIQVFENNFFHADMHPGNLLFNQSGEYMMVDFGIVDSISNENQNYIALNLLAFLEGDYQEFTRFHIEAGWLDASTDTKSFENAMRLIFEPIINQKTSQISIGKALMKLFAVAHHFRINIQPELVLLQRAFMNAESICRQIDPSINTWSIIHPFLKKWIQKRIPESSWQNMPERIKQPIQNLYHLHFYLKKHLEFNHPTDQNHQKKNQSSLNKIIILFLIIIIIQIFK